MGNVAFIFLFLGVGGLGGRFQCETVNKRPMLF